MVAEGGEVVFDNICVKYLNCSIQRVNAYTDYCDIETPFIRII